MQVFANIPRVLAQVEDLRNQQNILIAFEEYKKNVRIFVEDVKKEVSSLIDNYERTIAQLRAQNQKLKGGSPSKQFTRTRPSAFSSTENYSPLPSRTNQQVGSLLNMMGTAKSKVFASARDRSLEQLRLSPIFQKVNDDHSQINPEGEPFQKESFRYQTKNKRKRHREQELRYFLESGNKSMNFTTQKFRQAIGAKNKKQIIEDEAIHALHEEEQLSQKEETQMNKSLGDICNSLDTSYISKKARSQKKKRSNQIQNQIETKKKQEAIASEILKKRGIKSLLERLRENVDASPTEKVSPITASRMFSSNYNQKQEHPNHPSISNSKKNSKIMINPVPIDLEKKAKVTKKEATANSPPMQKRPQSILKQSTVLTHSISGISAIQFNL